MAATRDHARKGRAGVDGQHGLGAFTAATGAGSVAEGPGVDPDSKGNTRRSQRDRRINSRTRLAQPASTREPAPLVSTTCVSGWINQLTAGIADDIHSRRGTL